MKNILLIFLSCYIGLTLLNNGSITGQGLFILMMIALGIFKPILKASGYVDRLAQMETVAKEIKEKTMTAIIGNSGSEKSTSAI
ncbi:hypothetical protein GCWU000282_01213 [Catonella morbi ATCC 51271]|uniref:Uncharacterized protein n=2 Tax=Catonella TaxID=43996 RepID=V2Y728_9FIRM|nr:hypothetical protein GCWU000282_01213 [Catonella morbi ATCC 51271]